MEFVPNGDLKLSPSQILKMRWMLTLVPQWWHQFDVQRSFSSPKLVVWLRVCNHIPEKARGRRLRWRVATTLATYLILGAVHLISD